MMKNLIAAAALTAVAFGAQAGINGGVAANQSPSSFIDLSTPGIVTGGALYTVNALPNAAIPTNTAPPKSTVGTWLAAGPGNTNHGGGDAVVTFAGGTSFASFLWGSPDTYNSLLVTTTVGSYLYSSANFPTVVFNGDKTFASYIGFTTDGGEMITSMTFSSPTANAFEASNFSVTTPAVPEPETYALMLAGLGVIGFMARRRKQA